MLSPCPPINRGTVLPGWPSRCLAIFLTPLCRPEGRRLARRYAATAKTRGSSSLTITGWSYTIGAVETLRTGWSREMLGGGLGCQCQVDSSLMLQCSKGYTPPTFPKSTSVLVRRASGLSPALTNRRVRRVAEPDAFPRRAVRHATPVPPWMARPRPLHAAPSGYHSPCAKCISNATAEELPLVAFLMRMTPLP